MPIEYLSSEESSFIVNQATANALRCDVSILDGDRPV